MKQIEFNEIAMKIANDLVGDNFEPANELIPYSIFTDLARDYVDLDEIEVTEDEILIIRKYLIKYFCLLVKTKTKYDAVVVFNNGNNSVKVTKKVSVMKNQIKTVLEYAILNGQNTDWHNVIESLNEIEDNEDDFNCFEGIMNNDFIEICKKFNEHYEFYSFNGQWGEIEHLSLLEFVYEMKKLLD